MIFDFDTEIKRRSSDKDFQKAVRYLGNLSRYMQDVRFTKGGR